MLYLKNSLVILTILLFTLFFLTIGSTDDNIFIFPQKKITLIITDEKKQNNDEISKNFTSIDLPQKNPLKKKNLQQKKSKKNIKKLIVNKEKKD